VRADETDDLFHDGFTRGDPASALTMMTGEPTVSEAAQIPLLRLVTRGMVAETRMPEARAGRGQAAELMLPPEPTISRVHARFAYTRGEWWITVVGRGGALLNGTPLAGEHVVRDGDSIQWGRQAGALVSRVQIR
jgi:pSer/pThr/pTyr-binding forkhead associated (FHA) protein